MEQEVPIGSVSSGSSSVLTVSKTPTSGQFATLTDCINYINTQLIPPPSPTNPVGISVFPGIYNETSPITIPSWVNVIGFQENTVIENGNFIMSNNSTSTEIRNKWNCCHKYTNRVINN